MSAALGAFRSWTSPGASSGHTVQHSASGGVTGCASVGGLSRITSFGCLSWPQQLVSGDRGGRRSQDAGINAGGRTGKALGGHMPPTWLALSAAQELVSTARVWDCWVMPVTPPPPPPPPRPPGRQDQAALVGARSAWAGVLASRREASRPAGIPAPPQPPPSPAARCPGVPASSSDKAPPTEGGAPVKRSSAGGQGAQARRLKARQEQRQVASVLDDVASTSATLRAACPSCCFSDLQHAKTRCPVPVWSMGAVDA